MLQGVGIFDIDLDLAEYVYSAAKRLILTRWLNTTSATTSIKLTRQNG
jgi:hypothetical protein